MLVIFIFGKTLVTLSSQKCKVYWDNHFFFFSERAKPLVALSGVQIEKASFPKAVVVTSKSLRKMRTANGRENRGWIDLSNADLTAKQSGNQSSEANNSEEAWSQIFDR